ncbi:TRAP transporter small permease [Ammoniphilus sp. CFH 90114]|uniref:TRAP transporter small permease n=1 Tax=Ammoniphilus sp. CFH 90114 TaxID=2493665 RepID=UPI001F0BC1B6|nr:TRAP transporter small permease [Ammoniphilus sp. CFH 90114]
MRKAFRLGEDLASGVLIVVGLAIIFYGAFMRYVVNSPITWAEEISGFMIVWGALIGASVALRDEYHIRVELLYAAVPNRLKHCIDIFATFAGILYSIFLFYTGLSLVLFNYKIKALSMDLQLPMWMVYICLPLAGTLLLIRYLKLFVEAILRMKRNELVVMHSEADQHIQIYQADKGEGGSRNDSHAI